MSTRTIMPCVAIIGGGPAGLMAAEALSEANIQVEVFDAMPSLGRKFLLAGLGGLNITHSENYTDFCSRYAQQQIDLQPFLDQFTPDMLKTWVHELGIETFIGSSGRVFPKTMKAAPLLRAWLHRLRSRGVRMHVRHRWLGWNAQGELLLQSPEGIKTKSPNATILALGGASWPQLGSDGTWTQQLTQDNVHITPLESANCGFEVHWSNYIQDKFAGNPLKNVGLYFKHHSGHTIHRIGEFLIAQEGIEGSLIYAVSRELRQTISAFGPTTLYLDLFPQKTEDQLRKNLGQTTGGYSLAAHLKKRLGITGLKLALIHEQIPEPDRTSLDLLAKRLKALPIIANTPRPLAEAISTAGGVAFDNFEAPLQLKQRPNTWVAGEMLDWEAPTGGYLLTACLATGLAAGKAVRQHLCPK